MLIPAEKDSPARHAFARDELAGIMIEMTVRLGVLAVLLYWSFILIRPFITIAIWSIVLTIALYPAYSRLVDYLGGRRRVAAVLLSALNLVIVIGPATWLIVGLIDSLRILSERVDPAVFALPPPAAGIRSWPMVGEPLYQFWDLASTNLREAMSRIAPHLKPVGSSLLQVAAEAGTGAIKFLIALVIAGFLFSPGPSLAAAARSFARRLAADRGEHFIELAGATIRAVSRGVIGISALQALLAGFGLTIAGIPGAPLISSAVLILGIVQIGPALVLIPAIIWTWAALDTVTALLFTAYMIPVGLLDNVLRPLVMGRGLDVPVVVILVGVIGGTISYGITGLFLGPIVLAVIWELVEAWVRERDPA